MKKTKNIIIILALLMLVTIIILALLIQLNKTQENSETVDKTTVSGKTEESIVKSVTDTDTFFTIKNCVQEYYTVIKNLWHDNSSSQVFIGERPTEQIEMSSFFAKKLYNILGKKYIEAKNITLENIGNTFTQSNQMQTIVKEICSYEISEDLIAYFVRGYNWDFEESSKKDINIMVVVDENNSYFSVYPSEYIQKYNLNEVGIGDKLNIKESNFTVTKNEYNKYERKYITQSTLIQEYVDLYKFNITYDIESAYESLDEKYRNSKFGNLHEYRKYLKNNLQTIEVNKYTTDNVKDFTQYVCTTAKSKYFIINEVAPMQYSIMLDPYTIDLQTFVDEYNNSTETAKVALNIDKIKQAINDKDYKYVYNKLNATFKANNYPTLELLENYIKSNLFENNVFTCDDIEEQNGTYIFKIKVTSGNNDTTEEKNMNIIMKLLNGTEFEMSFGN